jgi:hypothetical protein
MLYPRIVHQRKELKSGLKVTVATLPGYFEGGFDAFVISLRAPNKGAGEMRHQKAVFFADLDSAMLAYKSGLATLATCPMTPEAAIQSKLFGGDSVIDVCATSLYGTAPRSFARVGDELDGPICYRRTTDSD